MIFSVSNDGIQWTLNFGPDSVTTAVNDVDQNITISSQEIPLAAGQLLLSRRQNFLNNHLARVPITLNQEGTIERREEVLSSVGAQDLDTSSYQVSDLKDIEFNWEDPHLDMDAVFRPGIDTPFSPTTFDDLLMGDGSVENPIVLDEEEDKENAPPQSTPGSVRPTEPPRLQRSRAFGARKENVPDYVYRNLFQKLLLCLCFDKIYVFQLIKTFFKNWSDICEIKMVLNVAALLLAATGFCIYQANLEKKVGHYSEISSETPCEKSTKSIVWTEAIAII